MPDPIFLFDDEDEPQTCWVEAIVDEDTARDELKGVLADEDGELGFRPVGAASKQRLRPASNPERWEKCDAPGGREFWEIGVY
jgi:hypothetical protein